MTAYDSSLLDHAALRAHGLAVGASYPLPRKESWAELTRPSLLGAIPQILSKKLMVQTPLWRNVAESVTPSSTHDSCDAMADAIRDAAEALNTYDAIDRLDDLWAKVEDVSTIAESRMRILLKQVTPPTLSDQQAWLLQALQELQSEGEDICAPDYKTIDSLVKLIGAVVGEIGDDKCRADIAALPSGGVEVRWDSERELTWIVWPPRLAWPGAHVRVYARESPDAPLIARTFHQAFGVIRHAKRYLSK